jgi:hypothetical protein
MTSIFRRSMLLLGPAVIAASLAAGCSAAPPSETTALGTSSEALTQQCPDGAQPDCQVVCAREDGCKPPVVSCTCPVAAPVCRVNKTCTWSAPPTTLAPGDFEPRIDTDNGGIADTDFPKLLKDAGCQPERRYAPGFLGGALWAVALCPRNKIAGLTTHSSGLISCDNCTGDPDGESAVLAWLVRAGGCQHWTDTTPRRCNGPSGGCDAIECVIGSQDEGVAKK